MIVGHIGGVGGPSVLPPYQIPKSLRLRSSNSAYLARTPTVTGDRQKWTFSAWIKRGTLGTAMTLSGAGTATDYHQLVFTGDTLQLVETSASVQRINAVTESVFRDPASHYHIHVSVDTTQSIAANGVQITVNGVPRSLTFNAYTQNHLTALNTSGVATNIGRFPTGTQYLDGVISEVFFIDGQALPPTVFGEFDSTTENWNPIEYIGTFGVNGYYLTFDAGSTLGDLTLDYSGNSNTFSSSGLSLTVSKTYDWLTDTPTNNFSTLNPYHYQTLDITLSNSNLLATKASSSLQSRVFGTRGLTDGKWYWEVSATSGPSSPGNWYLLFGIASGDSVNNYDPNYVSYMGSNDLSVGGWKSSRLDNTSTSGAYGANYTTFDIIGVALDCDALTLTFYKNGVSQGTITGLKDIEWFPFHQYDGSSTTGEVWFNFGQQPFSHTPPSGYQTISTSNYSDPAILNPREHFDVDLYVGDGIARSRSGFLFQPDFAWIKCRNISGTNHELYDSVRGATKLLSSNTTGQEATLAQSLTSFNSDGYSLGTGASSNVNTVGNSLVSWLFEAGNQAANADGTTASQVSVNPLTGISIFTYTGTGAVATVGHGLGVPPKMVIVKSRDAGFATNWHVFHKYANALPANGAIFLDELLAFTTSSTYWNNTEPTSSVITLGTANGANANGVNYVGYAFAEVPGFSKVGTFIGNGSTNGPFVNCGFKPKFLMIKCTTIPSTIWITWDGSRSPDNPVNEYIYPNLNNSEDVAGGSVDFLSNGFKVRNSSGSGNSNGNTFVFLAFADKPFQFSRAR